jgi:choice-of-anchor B domain-containing protein
VRQTNRRAALVLFLSLLFVITWARQTQLTASETKTTTATRCVNGMADIYPCSYVDLLAFMPLSQMGTDVATEAANLWGWTDPMTGKEYVILALTDATAFIDISDPATPIYLGQLPTQTISSPYRDVKVYANHAFIVADSPSLHGLQVFDLTQLREIVSPPVTFEETAHYDAFGNGHNIFINEETGYAYVARTEQCDSALYMIDVQDPVNPSFAGCHEDDGAASDTMCVIYHGPDPAYQGQEICVTSSDDAIVIGDVTDKESPQHLARLTYPGVARAHHAWLTDDHRYFLSADMMDEHHSGNNTRIFIWNFENVAEPELMGFYTGPTAAIDHNVWIRGNHAYVGNFRAGLRILGIKDIANAELTEAAFFDTYPANNNLGHEGVWAAYVYFDSGIIALSHREGDHSQQGLFLVRPLLEQVYLPLLVQD